MIFGGLQKQTLIDFPGKISCVLFTSGCNFRCPYCHNPDLVRGQNKQSVALSEERIYNFLEKRRGFLDGVVISGGEPTLHNDLSSICQNIKEMGYPIKLDTNGSRPEILTQLIHDGHIDFIAMILKQTRRPIHAIFYTMRIRKVSLKASLSSCPPTSYTSSAQHVSYPL